MEKESGDDQCIGNLEHHLHQLFSGVRVPGDDFVYSVGADMFSTLDEYCDDSTFHETKPPLLILDQSGSGKSALLSNWLQNKQRKLAQGVRKGDEFIFWHAVGCSRQSMNVNSLIRRLMHGLKNRFDLVRDVPFSQDRLSWELPRFFEEASKRGRLTIVIDGIHRLVTNEDSEAGLAWLPLDFPPNVRIILTATPTPGVEATSENNFTRSDSAKPALSRAASLAEGSTESKMGDFGAANPTSLLPSVAEDGGGMGELSDDAGMQASAPRGSKILAELKRRKWRSVRVKRMDRAQCRSALETYIQKSVQKETTNFTTGPFLTQTAHDEVDEVPPLDSAPGFLLFDTQVTKLLTHKLGGTPMFLRLFLQCAFYAVRRGFSLWRIWEDWLEAESVEGLLKRIMVTMEGGYEPSSESMLADKTKSQEAGALQTLRILYPWHPSFQTLEEEEDGDLENAELQQTAAAKRSMVELEGEEVSVPLSTKVTENLGDQQWLALGGFAETVLTNTALQIQDVLTSTIEHAQQMTDMEAEVASQTQSRDEVPQGLISASMLSHEVVPNTFNIGLANPLDLLSCSMKMVDEYTAQREQDASSGYELGAVQIADADEDASASAKAEVETARKAAEAAAAAAAAQRAARKEEERARLAAAEAERQQFISKTAGIETLPRYFIGGADVGGMGTILGNALALLYVARHGLKESEIWGLLAGLHHQESQKKMAEDDHARGGSLTTDGGETQAIVQICYTARGMLEDLCRAEDLTHCGFLSRGALTSVLHNLHPGLSFTDMLRLLEITSMMESDSAQYSEDILVDYSELTRRVSLVYERKAKSKLGDSSVLSYDTINRNKADKAEKRFPNNKDRSKAENFAGSMADDKDKDVPKSLGPVLEESLLQVLIALGVLHDQVNHVLVLPSDSDVLRQVVYNNYVLCRGGEMVWHGHLIHHFQNERNSMRRCEELPWHLQLCRRWHNMKDTLTDLSTFEMMYLSSDLRDEYMSYWVQLTEGPMYITDLQHKTAMAAQAKQVEEVLRGDRGRDPELAKILIQLDTASALNLTEKNARKLQLQNQVCPFDVVEEFNKSMEMWVHKHKPVASQISDKILQIARFLAEFSSKNDSQPPFLRIGVEMRALKLFEVDFDCYKEVITEAISEDPNAVVELTPDEDEAAKKMVEFFPAGRHTKGGNIYYYLRWMWTQFPWIALNQTVEVGSVCEVGGLASVLAAYAAGARGRGRAGPPTALIESAENFEDSVSDQNMSQNTQKAAQDTAIARSTRLWDVKKSDPTKVQFENTKSRKSAAVTSILVPQNQKDVMDMNLRKVRDDIANASAAKHKMPGKFRRSMEQELEAMKGIPHAQHCKRSLSRNTLFPSLEQHIKEKNKEIEADGELYSNALATMRLGGPGLPLEAGLEGEIKKLAEDEQMKAWNDRRGGALPIGSERELEYEREFERMVRLRHMANKTTTMLRERTALAESLRHEAESRDVVDEETADFMRSGESAIKQLKDKYRMMSDALDEGKRLNNGYKLLIEWLQLTPPFTEVHVGQQQDQLTLAKQQLTELQKLRHNMYMEAEREAAVKTRQVETKIQYFQEARNNISKKMRQLFPDLFASDDLTLDSETVNSLTSQEQRLITHPHRSAVNMTDMHIDTTAVGRAIEQGMKNAALSSTNSVSSAIEGAANIAVVQAPVQEETKKRETVKEKAKRHKKEREEEAAKNTESKFDKDSLQLSVLNAIFKSDADKAKEMQAKAKVMQATMMWEYIMEKTCSTSEEELIERFHDGKRLTETLTAQQNLVDSRLAQLRAEFDDSKKTLSECILTGGNGEEGEEGEDAHHTRVQMEEEAATASEAESVEEKSNEITIPDNPNDARFFENQLSAAEMHLATIQRQEEMSIYRINEVRTGVGHLMSLLDANKRMLHNLPKSAPPVMKSHNIAECISWCEERVLAINEAQMVDASNTKPAGGGAAAGGADDNKSLFARQTDYAIAVQELMEKQNEGQPRRQARKPKNSREGGGMSSMLINANDNTAIVNSPVGVLVRAKYDVDTANDRDVLRMRQTRDLHEEKFEAEQLVARIDGSGAGVHKFLTEALSTKEAQMLLRKTNLASENRKGRNSGYGYVLDAFIGDAGLANVASSASPNSPGEEEGSSSKKKKQRVKAKVAAASEGIDQDVAAVEENKV